MSRTYTEGQIEVVPVLLPLIDGISSVRVYVPKDLRTPDARKSVGKTLAEVHKRFKDGVPLLDPIEDMHIEDDNFKKIIRVPPDRHRICVTQPSCLRSTSPSPLFTDRKSRCWRTDSTATPPSRSRPWSSATRST